MGAANAVATPVAHQTMHKHISEGIAGNDTTTLDSKTAWTKMPQQTVKAFQDKSDMMLGREWHSNRRSQLMAGLTLHALVQGHTGLTQDKVP